MIPKLLRGKWQGWLHHPIPTKTRSRIPSFMAGAWVSAFVSIQLREFRADALQTFAKAVAGVGLGQALQGLQRSHKCKDPTNDGFYLDPPNVALLRAL